MLEQILDVNAPFAFLNRTEMFVAQDKVPRRIPGHSFSLADSFNHYRFYFPYRQTALAVQYSHCFHHKTII